MGAGLSRHQVRATGGSGGVAHRGVAVEGALDDAPAGRRLHRPRPCALTGQHRLDRDVEPGGVRPFGDSGEIHSWDPAHHVVDAGVGLHRQSHSLDRHHGGTAWAGDQSNTLGDLHPDSGIRAGGQHVGDGQRACLIGGHSRHSLRHRSRLRAHLSLRCHVLEQAVAHPLRHRGERT